MEPTLGMGWQNEAHRVGWGGREHVKLASVLWLPSSCVHSLVLTLFSWAPFYHCLNYFNISNERIKGLCLKYYFCISLKRLCFCWQRCILPTRCFKNTGNCQNFKFGRFFIKILTSGFPWELARPGPVRDGVPLTTVMVPGRAGAAPQSPGVPTHLCCIVHWCHFLASGCCGPGLQAPGVQQI